MMNPFKDSWKRKVKYRITKVEVINNQKQIDEAKKTYDILLEKYKNDPRAMMPYLPYYYESYSISASVEEAPHKFMIGEKVEATCPKDSARDSLNDKTLRQTFHATYSHKFRDKESLTYIKTLEGRLI